MPRGSFPSQETGGAPSRFSGPVRTMDLDTIVLWPAASGSSFAACTPASIVPSAGHPSSPVDPSDSCAALSHESRRPSSRARSYCMSNPFYPAPMKVAGQVGRFTPEPGIRRKASPGPIHLLEVRLVPASLQVLLGESLLPHGGPRRSRHAQAGQPQGGRHQDDGRPGPTDRGRSPGARLAVVGQPADRAPQGKVRLAPGSARVPMRTPQDDFPRGAWDRQAAGDALGVRNDRDRADPTAKSQTDCPRPGGVGSRERANLTSPVHAGPRLLASWAGPPIRRGFTHDPGANLDMTRDLTPLWPRTGATHRSRLVWSSIGPFVRGSIRNGGPIGNRAEKRCGGPPRCANHENCRNWMSRTGRPDEVDRLLRSHRPRRNSGRVRPARSSRNPGSRGIRRGSPG